MILYQSFYNHITLALLTKLKTLEDCATCLRLLSHGRQRAKMGAINNTVYCVEVSIE